ncbi:MAG: LPXTG cell wall anchor domain-containing protein [Defluviitaleaceae bacterium]|nr:LPXTG cell wall anchor domain-containing protein [Defluviitaleaceae bacterium]
MNEKNGYYIDGALISEGFYEKGKWVDAVYEKIWHDAVYEKIWLKPVYEKIWVEPEYEKILVAGRWVSSGGGTFSQEISLTNSRLSTGTLNENQQNIFADENGFHVRITNFAGQTGMGSRWEFILTDPAGNKISGHDAKIRVSGDFMHGGNFLGIGFDTSTDGFVPFPDYAGNITHIAVQKIFLEVTEEIIHRWIEAHYVDGELLTEGHYVYVLVEEGRFENGALISEGRYENGALISEGFYEPGEWVPPVYEKIWVPNDSNSPPENETNDDSQTSPENDTNNDSKTPSENETNDDSNSSPENDTNDDSKTPPENETNNDSNSPPKNETNNDSNSPPKNKNENIFSGDANENFLAPFVPKNDAEKNSSANDANNADENFPANETNNAGEIFPANENIFAASHEFDNDFIFIEERDVPLGFFSATAEISPPQQLPQTGADGLVGLFSAGLLLSVFAAITAARLKKRG